MKYAAYIFVALGFTTLSVGMNFADIRRHVCGISEENINNHMMFLGNGLGDPSLALRAIALMARVKNGTVSEHEYNHERKLLEADAHRKPAQRIYQRRASTGGAQLSY